MALINFGGVKEEVVTRKEFPMAKAREVLKDETIAVIGYGVQGPAQSLNMKDNGFNVIIGQAQQFKKDWDRAKEDGWEPGKDLFDIEEACERATIIEILVSDAAQKAIWPMIKREEQTSLSGQLVRDKAAIPEITGAAMEVPDHAAYCEPGKVLHISIPGAINSYSWVS